MSIKERQSNFELLRLLAMFMVLLLHCNYSIIGAVTQEEILFTPVLGFSRLFWEQLCLVCVNIFILISGWFGIKYKIKGIVSFLFQVLFIGLILCLICRLFGCEIPKIEMLKVLYGGGYYWFVTSYLVLYIFSPILNNFALMSDRKQYKTFLCSFFIIQFAFGWLIDLENFGLGYSALSFMGLYMLARYINRFQESIKLVHLNRWIYACMYFSFTIIPTIIVYYCLKKWDYGVNQLAYSSPFLICASISLFLIFKKIKLNNSLINIFASSSFSMYLCQLHPMVWPLFKNKMLDIYDSFGFIEYFLFSIVICVVFAIGCFAIDRIRIYVWNQILRLYSTFR